MKDDTYHGWDEDGLPKAHPKAEEDLHCFLCNTLVHSFTNETMKAWYEQKDGRALCVDCKEDLK